MVRGCVRLFFSLQHVPKCAVFLVGTLSSGEPSRQVSLKAMEDFAEDHKVEYLECEHDHIVVDKVVMSLVDNIMNNTGTGHNNNTEKSIES